VEERSPSLAPRSPFRLRPLAHPAVGQGLQVVALERRRHQRLAVVRERHRHQRLVVALERHRHQRLVVVREHLPVEQEEQAVQDRRLPPLAPAVAGKQQRALALQAAVSINPIRRKDKHQIA